MNEIETLLRKSVYSDKGLLVFNMAIGIMILFIGILCLLNPKMFLEHLYLWGFVIVLIGTAVI